MFTICIEKPYGIHEENIRFLKKGGREGGTAPGTAPPAGLAVVALDLTGFTSSCGSFKSDKMFKVQSFMKPTVLLSSSFLLICLYSKKTATSKQPRNNRL